MFTDPSFVTHRWNYKHDIEAKFLVEKLRQIVKLNNLENNLEVLEPFPDGGVQVIRKDNKTGKTIDKSYILEAIKMIYPNNENLPVSMFGDGHNDIPAMSPEKVIPITFNNAHKDVIEYVKSRNGFISRYDAPEDVGVVDGLIYLHKINFFGADSSTVLDLISKYFPSL